VTAVETISVGRHHRSKVRVACADAHDLWVESHDQSHPAAGYVETAITRGLAAFAAAVEAGAVGEYATGTVSVTVRLPADTYSHEERHGFALVIDESDGPESDDYEHQAVLDDRARALAEAEAQALAAASALEEPDPDYHGVEA